MRLKPSDPAWFSLLAILFVVVFVLQIATLLFVGSIALPIQAQSDTLVILENSGPRFQISRPRLLVRADRATPAGLEKYRPILSRELSRYDPAFLKLIRLRRIILCSDLTINGKARGGLALGSEGTVLLDVGHPGWIGEELLRRAIHHELFHVMDAILTPTPEAAETWARMNPTNFAYGGDDILDALETTKESPDRRTEIPGLLNYYSMVSVQEDRAELFSYMMASPDYLDEITSNDAIIRRKVDCIQHELLNLGRGFDTFHR